MTIGYVRLTREESMLKNLSAPAQRQDIADYAERSGLSDLQILEESKAVGGDVAFEKRNAGRELVRLCKEGRVAHIVVRDVDRLTRDLPLWLHLDDLCERNNVRESKSQRLPCFTTRVNYHPQLQGREARSPGAKQRLRIRG